MKKLSFYALAVAGLLFAACTSDRDVAVDNPQVEVPSEGYVSLAINLPTTPQVRAANDVFDDGLAAEYDVKTCALLIYQGSDETDATLLSSTQYGSDVLNSKKEDVDNDNITTSYLLTTTVGGIQAGKKLYALALLNYTGVLTFAETTPSLGGTDITNLKDVRNAKVQGVALDNTSNGFFMANAVLSTTPGGTTGNPTTQKDSEGNDSKVFQYAELDPTKIFDTKEKAEREPAGEILVERAVAKATMSVTLPETGVVNSSNCSLENIKWVIDNTEPATYVVRNPGDNSYIGYTSDYFSNGGNYRFVGNVSTKNATQYGTGKNYYRTYWCIDPQYSEKDAEGMLPTNYPTNQSGYDYSSAFKPLYQDATTQNAQYCYENTFDVAHQNYKNTTRAIIQVKLTDPATFYTVNGGTTKYSSVSDAYSYVMQIIMNHTDVVAAFQDNLKEGNSLDIDVTYFTVTTEDDSNNAPAGQVEITGITPSTTLTDLIGDDEGKIFNTGLTSALSTALDKAIEEANANFAILKYVDGVMYYEARFKHFAGMGEDDLAPWGNWETDNKPTSGNSIANAYPASDKRDQRYLGRYGMVRNNWYDVTVTAFNAYGYPVVPSVTVSNPGYDDPDTPDDKLEDNIAVKIHVLAWAKRTQSWGF